MPTTGYMSYLSAATYRSATGHAAARRISLRRGDWLRADQAAVGGVAEDGAGELAEQVGQLGVLLG
jgi:hypothetical protein